MKPIIINDDTTIDGTKVLAMTIEGRTQTGEARLRFDMTSGVSFVTDPAPIENVEKVKEHLGNFLAEQKPHKVLKCAEQ